MARIASNARVLRTRGRRSFPSAPRPVSGPKIVIDSKGCGAMIRVAVERGRMTKPHLKMGICGEHGGDPASIAFCEEVGLDYVSCSPYRVPVARLAAAQAALHGGGDRTA